MKCGALGHTNALGQPCGQDISAESKGCVWHTSDAARRKVIAGTGSLKFQSKLKLPADYRLPPFDSLETITDVAHKLAKEALTGTVDPRRISEARQCAHLALSAFAAQDQKRLVDAILRLQHGEAAVLLLQRMQEGLTEGRRKPLPTRMLPAGPDRPGNGETQ